MKPISRRQFLKYSIGTVLASSAGIGGYTWKIEPHLVETVRRDLPVEHLPASLRGATLAQISDLHIGPRVDDEYLIGAFRQLRALNPDIVVITGDIITGINTTPTQLRRVLQELPHGRRATLAVLGNHDYGPAWSDPRVAERVAGELASVGVNVLRNSTCDVDGLLVVGMDDLWADMFFPEQALKSWTPGRPAIVLCHNPDALDRVGWGSYAGWVLSGHTHGGQCRPPFLPPPLLPVKNRRYTSGEISLTDGRRVYINRGLGHLLQVRFNARPEMTVFTLT